MRIPDISIKREVSLGQIIMAAFFLFGGVIAWSAIPQTVIETKQDLKDHVKSVEETKKEFVRKDEYNAELRSVNIQLNDIKNDINAIKGLVLDYVQRHDPPASESSGVSRKANRKGG